MVTSLTSLGYVARLPRVALGTGEYWANIACGHWYRLFVGPGNVWGHTFQNRKFGRHICQHFHRN